MNLKNKIKSNAIQLCATLVAMITVGVVVISCNPDDTQIVANFNTITMQDEFDIDGAPNSSLWTFEIGDGTAQGIPGWGNNELQYYTDRPENAVVEDGMLKIVARQEAFEGSGYTSARIISQNLFEQQYGRFEARIKLPWGQGLWPAFWLLGNDCAENPWPNCGEIDVMEYLGDEPTVIFGSVHGPGYNAGDSVSKKYELQNARFDDEFHIFGVEWSPNRINFYVDDELYQSITPETIADEAAESIDNSLLDNAGDWVFNRPFFIIMNVAVGGNLPGPPNADTVFPQTMYVDYVRVYSAD
ncbi:glycoside hydrolase family 16 protein [Winogradskyella tangerina]|uniref:glycoside hydrolase family 16 protein n=1 Tax=Winogradskyella tangerina TaxID=2023240 RepID=UPI001E30ACAF|nr:glycoside hydrolase family 16 protein [Winogradskyella tangerina]